MEVIRNVLIVTAGAAFFLSAALSGALVSGDRMRANNYSEQPQDRVWRGKAATICLAAGVVAGALAWLTSRL